MRDTNEVGRSDGEFSPIDLVQQRIDEQQQALAAGIDDPCVLQYRQHVGCTGKRIVPLGLAGFEGGDQVSAAVGRTRGTLGDLADDRQNRAFDRTLYRAVGSLGCNREGFRPYLRIGRTGAGFGSNGVGQSAKDL